MQKKPATPTLNEIWDLEDKFTAFVGSRTGAKFLSAAPQSGRTFGVAKASGKKGGIREAITRLGGELKTLLKSDKRVPSAGVGTRKMLKVRSKRKSPPAAKGRKAASEKR